MMTNEEYRAVAEWAMKGGSLGLSSRSIAMHMMGMTSPGDYPHDGDDFGRCEGLLDMVPSFRARLNEMASVNAYWAALVLRWEEIRRSPDKYALIQSIVRPVEDKDGSVVRLGKGVTLRFH